ncbi:arginine--tRNA ligase [Candidatus Berkelbacteria bacterium]|nr:arginine--tRNA ligase [Candidatus Berkelbacteria bacterium]
MSWFLPQLVNRVRELLGPDYPITTELPSNQSAWLAVPVFGVAKQQRRDVADVGKAVAETLSTIEGVAIETAGGFVNITPTDVSDVVSQAADPDYPTSELGKGQRILIEFAGPNVAKPMGIGHLRSTILGDSLQRIFRALGYDVQSHNYLGDWGTQFGKVLVAYQRKFGNLEPELPSRSSWSSTLASTKTLNVIRIWTRRRERCSGGWRREIRRSERSGASSWRSRFRKCLGSLIGWVA